MVDFHKKSAETVFEKEKFQIITIGSSSKETFREIKMVLNKEFDLSYVPFVNALEEIDYLTFQVRKSPYIYQISTGAAGCLLAHRKAWSLARESKSYYSLVLEDDAILTKYGERELGNLLDNFRSLDLNLLHLGHPLKSPLLPTPRKLFDLSLHVLTRTVYESVILKSMKPKVARNQFPPSAHAYLISRTFADSLYSLPLNFGMPVDVFMGALAQVKQHKIARVRTPLFLQSGRPSTIRES